MLPRPPAHPSASIALWPLAALASVLPLLAAVGAAWWSMRYGLVPSCNPFFEGCTSISRAARHELANLWFQALMLPAATVQGLVWIFVGRWLQDLPVERRRGERWIMPLGVMAALALVLYGTFLGTEGAIYRVLRHYGTAAYFGFTCICLLLTGGAIQRAAAAGVLPLAPALSRTILVLGATLVAMGIVNSIVAAMLVEPWKDRIENIAEWWGSSIFVLGFAALALMWRRIGLVIRLGAADAGASPPAPPGPAAPR
jgi:hypothetical protein